MITYIRTHFPALMAFALIIGNALIQAGYWTPGTKLQVFLNAVLAATGIGVLHFRTIRK